jgi:hypothetical protein
LSLVGAEPNLRFVTRRFLLLPVEGVVGLISLQERKEERKEADFA